MTNSHPLAALIAEKAKDAREVFDGTCETAKQAVDYFEQLLLAALEAAPHVNETPKSEHDAGNVLTVPDLVEAGKVLEGVTPGPWKADYSKWEPSNFIVQTDHPCRRVLAKFDGDGDGPDAQSLADARFIAWCREGVPALIALATAQAAQIAGLAAKARESAMQELASLGQAQEAYEAQLAAEADAATLRTEVERLRGQVKALCDAVEADDGSDHHYFTISGLAKALRTALEGKA